MTWYLAAFTADLPPGLTPIGIGDRRLMAVHANGAVRVFDAVCPHRGASLAHGGTLDGDAVLCPFHNLRVHLGASPAHRFSVDEVEALDVGGLLFVFLPDGPDFGFRARAHALREAAHIHPGFRMEVAAEAELVIENAFDGSHFLPVHRVLGMGTVRVEDGPDGECVGRAPFELPPTPWQGDMASGESVHATLVAKAYSPWLIVSDVEGPRPYAVITGAVPTGPNSCTVRVSMAVPKDDAVDEADAQLIGYMFRQMEQGIGLDQKIWEHMDPTMTPDYVTPNDDGVIAFRRFCAKAMGGDGGA